MQQRSTRALTATVALFAVLGVAACSSGTEHDAAVGPPSSAAGSPDGTTTAPTSSATAPTSTAPAASIAVSPRLGSVDVAPSAPLTVRSTGAPLGRVSVTGPDGAVAGTLSPDQRTWTAHDALAYGSTYTVKAQAAGASPMNGTIDTATPRTLTYASATPNPDITDVGAGQPIALYFDEDVTDHAAAEKALKVTSDPPVEGAWRWISDREVHYRPKDFWPAGTHVSFDVDIYGVNLGDGVFGQEDRHLAFDVHDQMTATVNTDDLTLRAYRNGELVRTMPVSLGKPGHETPSGVYVVQGQDALYQMDSSTYGVPIDGPDGYLTEVEYASRLSNSGIFVHAAPWSVGDQGVRNVSHGCLNVSTDDAQWFYENFGRGDVVTVQGTGVPLDSTDGFGDWNLSWAQWTTGAAAG